MLLEFRIQNFRSFYHEAVLSMLASKQRVHSEFLIVPENKSGHVLPSAVIYGANASGKTSLILALTLIKEMVVVGNIRQTQDNHLLSIIELFPFIHDYQKFIKPIKFEITFLHEGIEFTYGIEFISSLRDDETPSERKIISEYLIADDVQIFSRSEKGITLAKSSKALKFYKEKIKAGLLEMLEKQINENLEATDLFLSNAFKSAVNSDLAHKAIKWFTFKLSTFINFDESKFEILISDKTPMGEIRFNNGIMQALLKHADFGPQDVVYVIDNKENSKQKTTLRSKYHISGKPDNEAIDVLSDLFESKGTLKILKFALPFITALENGNILVIDELDSSMHPDLIAGIIRVFNNPEINKKGAQLIFNTHNPIYLNRNLFRRDQIVFVSKDKETFESEIYTLADFKTFGEKAVREDERYMKNYINGKYGALPFVDFEGAVQEALEMRSAKGV
jgi:AAA15 family ATPase/GTPase